MRFLLNNWSDEQCVKILENIRKALHLQSRVLIHEYVLQYGCREPEAQAMHIQQAPEPLLSNYGVGRIRPYNHDLHMMVTLNGKARTMHEYLVLARQAGLKFERILESGESSILEFTLA